MSFINEDKKIKKSPFTNKENKNTANSNKNKTKKQKRKQKKMKEIIQENNKSIRDQVQLKSKKCGSVESNETKSTTYSHQGILL